MKKGFTLIEMLVVVSIIALLAAVIFSFIQSTNLKTRDIKRVSDIKRIQTAIQLYYIDHNGTYPPSGSTAYPDNDWNPELKNALVPTYISKLPVDPANDATNPDVNLIRYYSFFNTYPGVSAKCKNTSVILSSLGETNTKLLVDDCGINWNRFNNIVLQY